MDKAKILYIEARKKLLLDKSKLYLLKDLQGSIYIIYSIQYKSLAEQVKKELEKNRRVIGFKQVLGCSDIKTNADIILYIGDGRFHPLNTAMSSGKEVYMFDNFSLSKISNQEIEKLKKEEKAKLVKFFSSESVGIIVSTKDGQNKLNEALQIKNKLEKKGKKAYIFIADTINISELENFPVDLYINTACPGLALDSKKVIDYSRIIDTL